MIMYEKLRKELRDFFGDNGGQVCVNPERLATLEKCRNWLEEFASAHPQASAYELRRKIYECAVMFFRPRLFPHSPFFADISGNGGWHFSAPGHWLLKHNISRIQNQAPDIWKKFSEQGGECFFLCCGPYFDEMHNCPPLSNVLKHGFRFYYEKAQQTLAACRSTEETEFIRTAIAGLEAVKTILEKTAAAAQIYRQQADDPEIQQNMAMIADTAGRVPWNPPQTFYEGLCTIWFVREIMGELDGMATNTLGRPDAWLETLYQADLDQMVDAGIPRLLICGVEAHDLSLGGPGVILDRHYDLHGILRLQRGSIPVHLLVKIARLLISLSPPGLPFQRRYMLPCLQSA